ncbi:MAG: galactosyldiacylglycerol synthase, partial [Bryobacterales bacterium]|nr:galactosyldiacylglycerol synthase [Bryobacterales bacterium]
MAKRPAVDFIFFDAGGGHRAAATALDAVIRDQSVEWDIRLVDLQDVLVDLDIFRKLTGLGLEDIYNRILENGWTLGSTQLLPLMHGIIRLYHTAQVRELTKYWSANPPNMVVSLVPNFDRSMWQALQKVNPRIPFVTVLTDMADYPPHFWIERQKQIFICGTDRALQQVLEISPESSAHRVSGMILNPKFYDISPVDVSAERRRLGLDPSRPTGVVLFGGMGSKKMDEIFLRIDKSSLDVQLILVCGKNEKLRKRLAERPSRIIKFVEGFTREIPRYM